MDLLYLSSLFLDISHRECGNSTTKLSAFVIFFAPFFVVIYLALFSPFIFFVSRYGIEQYCSVHMDLSA